MKIKYNGNQTELMKQVAELGWEMNRLSNRYSVWVNYSGHVQEFSVRIAETENYNEWLYEEKFYMGWEGDEEFLEIVRNDFKELFRTVIENKDIDWELYKGVK